MTDTLDDKLYEILDAFALEYLDAHMEPDYGIGQRLQVEAELLQDVKKQINLYIEERERLARLDEHNKLDKFLDNQKAVGAVRAWSLQRKQTIKSELEK